MTEQQTKKERRRPVPGQYVATLADYAITETKKGDPQILGIFDFKDANGDQFQQPWFGSFSGKAREFTMRSLKVLGFDEAYGDLSALANGVDSGILSLTKRVSITVEERTNENTGEVETRIAWVNELGGGLMKNKVNQSKAKDILSRIGMLGGANYKPPSDQEVPF